MLPSNPIKLPNGYPGIPVISHPNATKTAVLQRVTISHSRWFVINSWLDSPHSQKSRTWWKWHAKSPQMKRDKQFWDFSFHPLENSQRIVWQMNPAIDLHLKKIMKWLENRKWKVMPNMNSQKLFVFVKTTEEWNATNLQERTLQFNHFGKAKCAFAVAVFMWLVIIIQVKKRYLMVVLKSEQWFPFNEELKMKLPWTNFELCETKGK
jgi:hypothetical protein